MMERAERIQKLLKQLVAIPSDTGTNRERKVENAILKQIAEISYFKQNTSFYGAYTLDGDLLNRRIVWALAKGKSRKTIVLLHHHDVVDAADYGELANVAYDIDEIKKQLLKRKGMNQSVANDLVGEEWLFGRGSADMKAGAAIQLILLEDYTKLRQCPYNIVLLSVPDEENMSMGMRQGVSLLKQLKEKYQLEYSLLINSEPHERTHPMCGTLYTGSVGKLMPVIYVQGKSSHIGNVFEGMNPITIAQQIVEQIELNVDLCDQVGEEHTMPPSLLYFRDRKKEYNVSTPSSVGLYFSLLSLSSSVKDVTRQLMEGIHLGCEEAVNKLEKRYKKYNQLFEGNDRKHFYSEIEVKLFGELYQEAKSKYGQSFLEAYQKEQDLIKQKLEKGEINLPESTFLFIEAVLKYVPYHEGLVVLAYAPPYYPSVHIEQSALVNQIDETVYKLWGEHYHEQKYFMGISDMSYIGNGKIDEMQAIKEVMQANMPQWKSLYYIPFEDMGENKMPMINIGPWGKDLHQWSERVYKKDVLEHTPEIIWRIMTDTL